MSVTSDAYCKCEPKSSVYATRGLEPYGPGYGDQVFLTIWMMGIGGILLTLQYWNCIPVKNIEV